MCFSPAQAGCCQVDSSGITSLSAPRIDSSWCDQASSKLCRKGWTLEGTSHSVRYLCLPFSRRMAGPSERAKAAREGPRSWPC